MEMCGPGGDSLVWLADDDAPPENDCWIKYSTKKKKRKEEN